jgi:DNA-binding response OmpR family regulator
MKLALLFEVDRASRHVSSAVLRSMGYVPFPVYTTEKALQAAYVIKFDVVVTCTAIIPGDRRSLTAELKRCLPNSAILLMADPVLGVHSNGGCAGVSRILTPPLTAQDLRSVVEFGLDGNGLQPASVGQSEERRVSTGCVPRKQYR